MEVVGTVAFGVLFFALLMVSVALHEVGHLLPAKAFGVRVPRYFVGFGRTLWSTRRGETEYGVKLLPLGGFVQLLGMYPPARVDARPTRLQRLADEARAVEWEDIRPQDDGRLFYQQPTWQKLIIMAGGIAMNLLLAFLLLWGVTGLHGVYRTQPVVAAIQDCVLAAPRPEDPTCRPGDPASPAAQMGLRAGDRIVAFNGTPIATYDQLTSLIRANRDQPATLSVIRDGETIDLPTAATIVAGVRDELDPSRTVPAGWLGVIPQVERVRGGPVDVAADLGRMSTQSIVALVQFPVKVFTVAVGVVTGAERDLTSPLSIVGASVLAGETAVQEEVSVADRVATFASLLASVNLFLALFNLVPLPPLDGGHIVGALCGELRRWIARLAGRPDPGPVDTAKLVPVAYAVGGFLLLCGVVLIVADVVSPIRVW